LVSTRNKIPRSLFGRLSRPVQAGFVLFLLAAPVLGQVKVTNTYQKTENGLRLWTVWIDESDDNLQKLHCVEYTLPPTFRDSIQRRCEEGRMTHFALTQSSSAEFTILLKLEWKDGHVSTQQYVLDLHYVEAKLGSPIAIDSGGSSDLYAVSLGGVVTVLREAPSGFVERRQFVMLGADSPVDLASSRSEPSESVFICSVEKSSDGKSFIYQYSPEGKVRNRWLLRQPCTGIAFDSEAHAVYFGTADSNDLFKIDIRSGTGPTSFGEIHKAHDLGALAVDPFTRRIYAVGLAGESVYEYDLATKKSRSIAQHLGSIRALHVDAGKHLLYIADRSGKRIMVVKTGGVLPTAEIFSQDPTFNSPSGLAATSNGGLAVSDSSAQAIFVLSSTGQVVSRYP
jgi:hypothetical protein